MALDGVSGNTSAKKAEVTQNTTRKKSFDKNYQAKQEALAAQIKPKAASISDLKNAKNIKEEQIALAEQYGDTELAKALKEELKRIEQDIQKNETSIFEEKKN